MKTTGTQALGKARDGSAAWTLLFTGLLLGVLIAVRLPSAVAGSTLPGASVSLSPAQGPVGSVVSVTGTGYGGCRDHGGRTVTVLWDGSSTGVRAPVQDDGTFSATITVRSPASTGHHLVYSECADGAEWASAAFTLTKPQAR